MVELPHPCVQVEGRAEQELQELAAGCPRHSCETELIHILCLRTVSSNSVH